MIACRNSNSRRDNSALFWLIAILSLAMMCGPSRAQVYEEVVSFAQANYINPDSFSGGTGSGLVTGTDGNFYGTSLQGGVYGFGSVFTVTPAGTLTTLVSFTNQTSTTDPNRGTFPHANLVRGTDGNFYGTTAGGGANSQGTVFRMTPTGVMTTVVDFDGSNSSSDQSRGSNPLANLIQGTDGNFYGTTALGGINGRGTVFKMVPNGTVSTNATMTTIMDFSGGNSPSDQNRGGYPLGGLVQASDGNFYGTTNQNGANNFGTIFRVTSGGIATTLVDFTDSRSSSDQSRGYGPTCGLFLGSDSNLYGTTSSGGVNGAGTVFKMTLGGTITTLVDFSSAADSTSPSNPSRGNSPQGSLFRGSDGYFYGTTEDGGVFSRGTIFKMSATGSITTLIDFTPSTTVTDQARGAAPTAALVQGGDGNLYGSTSEGGAHNGGTIFCMTPSGTITTLVDSIISQFSTFGIAPYGNVCQGNDGNLYGTTSAGGANSDGTVFKLTLDGTLSSLVNFTNSNSPSDPARGSGPSSGLIKTQIGDLYGTTRNGGQFGQGTVYKITSAGAITTLVDFTDTTTPTDQARGAAPSDALLLASDGNLYGTTQYGGVNSGGTIFKVTTLGIITTLADLPAGAYSYAGLAEGSDGFYGVAAGHIGGGGFVFKVTSSGTLTDVADFPGTSVPLGGLISDNQSNFYGTTSQGGANGKGSIFKMTPGGVISTLVDFTGSTSASDMSRGAAPAAALFTATDGNFYGTTFAGGTNGLGTVFMLSPGGAITTLYDCTGDSANPEGPLIQASDGNLYGTAQGNNGGSVFKFAFAGLPNVYLNSPMVISPTSAIIKVSVDARGSSTSVTAQYGTSSSSLTSSLPLSAGLNGYLTTPLGGTLTNLTSGTTYYYQLVATNSTGTTTSPIQSFTTLEAPVTLVSAPTNVLPTSATFTGTVHGFGENTSVTFQYGTDGNTFPNTVAAVQSPFTSTNPVVVTAAVAGLTPGTTYYYRISAINSGGTVISGVTSFTTLTAPVCAVSPATLVTSQSAQLNGTVNAAGSPAAVTIEYGTDNTTFPISVGATPGTVNGTTTTPVSVVISNSASTPLKQGTTYFYRVRATGTTSGLSSVSPSSSFSLDILSGFAQQFPSTPAAAQGIVLVNLSPAGINSGWQFAGEQLWRSSGIPAQGLVSGNYNIVFEPVPGFNQPPEQTVSVTSGGAATVVNATYYPAAAGGAVGGLTIDLVPQTLPGTGWRFYGETAWRTNGSTVSNLTPGNYLVQCEPVSGQTTPAIASVTVTGSQTSIVTLTYVVASTPTGAQPVLLSPSAITDSTTKNLPYAYVGQIRSAVGSATGFVVTQRVVATAAHVVFDGVSNSFVTGLQWLFQREAGTFEPAPQTPVGSYIFTSYSSLAHADAVANTGSSSETASPAAQNLDAAALYFFSNAGNGGFGGYLASNSQTNEYLASTTASPNTRMKMLVGYPVDGIPTSEQGQMFATPAVVANFQQVLGTDSSGDPETNGLPYQTYATSDITSVGGNSGGPLCVQFDNGTYYPAAIYLGGSGGQTVVRAIDNAVIDLFNRAAVSGAGGANNVGGGVTVVNTTLSASAFSTASLLINIVPTAASNATWSLSAPSSTTTQFASGTQLNFLSPGSYTLFFTPASGFFAPATATVTLTSGQLSTVTATYEGITAQPQNVSTTSGGSATFSVSVSGTPTGYQWQKNGVNMSGATSPTFTKSGVATGDAGSYNVMVTWGTDGSMASSTAALNVGTTLTAQTITFPAIATQTFGVAPLTLTASASSTLPVTYSVVSGPAKISGSTLTITGAGSVTVQASQSGNSTFASAPIVSRTFTVNPALQTITFPAIATKSLGAAPIVLSSSTSSGLPVSYSLVSGPAILQGTTLTITGPGTITVQASQPGNTNFASASTVTESFQVTNAAPINDTPTMPQWALIILASLLVFSASKMNVGKSDLG